MDPMKRQLSEETKAKIRLAALKRYQDPAMREKTSVAAIQRWSNPEERQRASDRASQKPFDPVEHARLSEAAKKRQQEHSETYSKAMKNRMTRPEERERARDILQRTREEGKLGRKQPYRTSDETKAKLSEIAKNRGPMPPETRQKVSVSVRATWANPELREQQRAVGVRGARSTGMKYPSSLERHVREVLIEQRIPFEYQVPIGDRYCVDFLVDGVVIEADGKRWHSSEERIAYGKRRDDWLTGNGYTVIHLQEQKIKSETITLLYFLFEQLALHDDSRVRI